MLDIRDVDWVWVISYIGFDDDYKILLGQVVDTSYDGTIIKVKFKFSKRWNIHYRHEIIGHA